MDQFARMTRIIGESAMEKLHRSRVAVFGLGGVGGICAEYLVRAGIGKIDLIDHDVVSLTNLNRQILATHDSIGRSKVEVARERLLSINPELEVEIWNRFYLPENAGDMPFSRYDYLVDAVDTVAAKLEIILQADKAGVPVISCMGAGNKLDPSALRVADISETSVCPLARVMRQQLRKRGILHLKVVYSQEKPRKPEDNGEEELPEGKRAIPGSSSFVPSVAGLLLANQVVLDLAGITAS